MTRSILCTLALLLTLPLDLHAAAASTLVGKKFSDTKDNADYQHIEFEVERVDSPRPRDEILLQIPSDGFDIATITSMFLRVSNGVVIPLLIDASEQEAQALLEAKSIVYFATYRHHPGVPEGHVAGQIPPSGTRIDATIKVVFLDVSNDSRISIPTIANTDMEEARLLLESKGFLVMLDHKVISTGTFSGTYECKNGVPFLTDEPYTFRSIATTPPSGALVSAGTKVTLRVTEYVQDPPFCGIHDKGAFRPQGWKNLRLVID